MKGATVRVSVPDGTQRTWRTLWRERPRERVLFIGRITGGELHRSINGPSTLKNMTAEDALADFYSVHTDHYDNREKV